MTAGPSLESPQAGDPDILDTPAGRRVLVYLDALNSGDRDTLRDAILAHSDPSVLERLSSPLCLEAYVSRQMAPHYESAGLGYEFHSMRCLEGGKVRVALRNRLTEAWVELRVPLARDSHFKIAGIVDLEPGTPPADAPPPARWSDLQIVERTKICLDRLIEDDAFSGAVLVAKDGQPLLGRACGLASKSYQVPNRLDTKFNIASVGKMFTGVTVAQLAEQGKLSFEDPATKYLPADWLDPEIGASIQIRHLLTHTSGLGDYFGAVYSGPASAQYRALDDYRPLVAGCAPAFVPGTKWSYSNVGMLLLGVVIEQVTGESYFDHVREHVYAPAGMLDTDAFEKDVPVLNRATGYTKGYVDGAVVWRSNLATPVVKGGPSGGSLSTVGDLMRFDVALRAHKLLTPAYSELVLTPKPEIGSSGYGYGFFVSRGNAGRIAGHGGEGRGINAQFRTYLNLGYTIAILSNYDPPSANIVHNVCQAMIDLSIDGVDALRR
jgi:CubicO group peptidase (beta-lactamase class C family)